MHKSSKYPVTTIPGWRHQSKQTSRTACQNLAWGSTPNPGTEVRTLLIASFLTRKVPELLRPVWRRGRKGLREENMETVRWSRQPAHNTVKKISSKWGRSPCRSIWHPSRYRSSREPRRFRVWWPGRSANPQARQPARTLNWKKYVFGEIMWFWSIVWESQPGLTHNLLELFCAVFCEI